MLDLLIISELLKSNLVEPYRPYDKKPIEIEVANMVESRATQPTEDVIEEVIEEVPVEEVPVEEVPVEEPILTDYRQTFYSVEEGETGVGYVGMTMDNPLIREIDNVMHYNDVEFGWLPIIAIDINEVIESGLNEVGTYNYYGTVYNVQYEDGTTTDAIVLDSCGACTRHDRIDLWVYDNDYTHDKEVDSIFLKRSGF